MDTVTVTPLWDTFIPYATAVVTAACGTATLLANSWLKAHNASLAQDDLDQALEHVPGLFTQFLQGLAMHNSGLSVPTAISAVATAIIQSIPAQVKTLGISQATVESFVAAKIAKEASAGTLPGPAALVISTTKV